MANEGKFSTKGRFALGGTKFCFERIRRLDRNTMIDHTETVMCGTYEHNAANQSDDIKEYGFEVVLQPTHAELAILLPLIGFTETSGGSGIYRPNETEVAYTTAKIDEVINVRSYTDVKIDKAIFQASRSQPLRLRLVCMAKTAADGASFSETGAGGSHYVFSQGVLTLNGSAYYMSSWVFAVDNRLRREFNNSITATNIDQRDRVQYLSVNLPFNTEGKTIHDLLWSSSRIDGFSGNTVFTRGANSATFAFDNLKAEGNNPDFYNREELRQDHTFKIFDTTSGGNTEPSSKVTLATAS